MKYTNKMPMTTTYFPSNPLIMLSVCQQEDWCFISSKQSYDHVSSLQIFPHITFSVNNPLSHLACLMSLVCFLSMTEKWPWPCLVPPLPLSPQLVWVGSPGPSAVVSTQPNGHRWLGLLCILQPSWHGSLGSPAAPWPAASMGHSNTAITSWCFVSIGVAGDKIWLFTLKYGSSCREIQQRVKQRWWDIQCRNSVYSFFLKMWIWLSFHSWRLAKDDILLGHPCVPYQWPQWSGDWEGMEKGRRAGVLVGRESYSCTAPCSRQTAACYCVR